MHIVALNSQEQGESLPNSVVFDSRREGLRFPLLTVTNAGLLLVFCCRCPLSSNVYLVELEMIKIYNFTIDHNYNPHIFDIKSFGLSTI